MLGVWLLVAVIEGVCEIVTVPVIVTDAVFVGV